MVLHGPTWWRCHLCTSTILEVSCPGSAGTLVPAFTLTGWHTCIMAPYVSPWQCCVLGSCASRWSKNSSQAAMPSSWRMLVYSEETSRVTRRLPGGNLHVGNLLNLFIKFVVSWICDGSWVTLGRRKKNPQSVKCFLLGHDSNNRSTRVPSLVYFGVKIESCCSWMMGD